LGTGREAAVSMDKRALTERDICAKFITPALRASGWDEIAQIREEVFEAFEKAAHDLEAALYQEVA
jgi:type I site-specific restriction endonuclease